MYHVRFVNKKQEKEQQTVGSILYSIGTRFYGSCKGQTQWKHSSLDSTSMMLQPRVPSKPIYDILFPITSISMD